MDTQTFNNSSYEQTKPRILVVDDNEEIRQMLESYLNESGFTAVSAGNGYAGRERLNREYYDLVVTDICMSGMNGNDLLQYIRKIGRHLPVIAVTASPDLALSDFDLVIRKPFEIKALVASIQSLLNLYPAITHHLNSVKTKLLKQLQEIEHGYSTD